jgi:hypothetical protein
MGVWSVVWLSRKACPFWRFPVAPIRLVVRPGQQNLAMNRRELS